MHSRECMTFIMTFFTSKNVRYKSRKQLRKHVRCSGAKAKKRWAESNPKEKRIGDDDDGDHSDNRSTGSFLGLNVILLY
jgi:hypothetical protein